MPLVVSGPKDSVPDGVSESPPGHRPELMGRPLRHWSATYTLSGVPTACMLIQSLPVGVKLLQLAISVPLSRTLVGLATSETGSGSMGTKGKAPMSGALPFSTTTPSDFL